MIKKVLIFCILFFFISSCTTVVSDEKISEIREFGDINMLHNIQHELSQKKGNNWRDYHNLGYIEYVLWELGEGGINNLIQSLSYFQESYSLGEDKRTKHNIKIIQALLDELLSQEEEQEKGVDNEVGQEEKGEDENENGNHSEGGDSSEEGVNNIEESGNNGESDEVQPQSEQIFQELGFGSEQELIEELERYTEEIMERQERNLHELRRNDNSFANPVEEFFYRGNPFFQDLQGESEKDW